MIPARHSFSMALVALTLGIVLSSCSTPTREGAERGAKVGAVGGLVGGAVASLFWGGDAVNNALRSAAVGAASGAAMGAVSAGGAKTDQKPGGGPSQSTPPVPTGQPSVNGKRETELRRELGDANFAASEELARCRHVSAIARAETAFASETDPKRRAYALLIQAMAAEESENAGKANAVYAQWAGLDPTYADRNKARAEALDGILEVQRVRREYGLPVLCA